MADTDTVCSMCGDIGFPEKIFQCSRCRSRFQHSYCSNYYEEESGVCNWCLSVERSNGITSKKKKKAESSPRKRPELYGSTGDRVKRGVDRDDSGSRGSRTSTSSSSKPAGRKYKLLKDVLC